MCHYRFMKVGAIKLLGHHYYTVPAITEVTVSTARVRQKGGREGVGRKGRRKKRRGRELLFRSRAPRIRITCRVRNRLPLSCEFMSEFFFLNTFFVSFSLPVCFFSAYFLSHSFLKVGIGGDG